MKEKATESVTKFDFNSPESLKQFRKAAKAFNARATKSEATAREVLVSEGIYTKSGKLTKNYS